MGSSAFADLDVRVVPVATTGLGNTSYLVGSGDSAVAVDVPRDAWRLAEVAAGHGWRITHAIETHVHNDYLSGALELREAIGTTVVAPAEGGYAFEHRGATDAFELTVGRGGLVALSTPGHTPEHLSWQLQDGDGQPRAVFSGGSLLIGGVGRTDLLGPARVRELTEAQFASMRRLAELPDDTLVYPTHGAGSFCVAGSEDAPTRSTIGALRTWNPAFAADDLTGFERQLAIGRTRYPVYYRRMAPLNRRGPRLLGRSPEPRALTAQEVLEASRAGVWLIDVRDREAYAARHIAGSWNIELGDSMAAYVGWLLPFDAPVCLVVDDPAEEVEAAEELLRIGFDHVVGHLHGGLDAWVAMEGPTRSYDTASWEELRAWAAGHGGGTGRILDVRQPYEWREGAIPGSRRIFVADLPAAIPALERDGPWLVACRTGVRATIAASMLDAAGVPVRVVTDGGVPALPPAELRPAG